MNTLKGKVAIVAGASRGAGRGIALALGEAGATVYIAARTSRGGAKPEDGAPGTVEDTAEEVDARGGRGIPIRADLSNEGEVETLFRRAKEESGRLDLVANSVWGPNFMPVWGKKFWELDSKLWRETQETVSVCWWTTVYAMKQMSEGGGGLVIHVTDNYPGDAHADRGQILHDLGHESLNRLIASTSRDAKKSKVAVVGLNPGFMRTERVVMQMTSEKIKEQFRFHLSESVEFIGRAAAALAGDSKVLKKTGQLLWAADLAEEYGFTDVDGRIPRFDYSNLM